MVIEKLGDDRLIMSLDEPMQDADELNRLGLAALNLMNIPVPDHLDLESFVAGRETLIFLHCERLRYWKFTSLSNLLYAARRLLSPNRIFFCSEAGEWYIASPEHDTLRQFAEPCPEPSHTGCRLELPAKLFKRKEDDLDEA